MALQSSNVLREYVAWATQQSAPAGDVKSWAESVGWSSITEMFEKGGTNSWSSSFKEHTNSKTQLPLWSSDDLENVE